MTSATSLQDQAALIANIFLVLPDLPKEKPEWLDVLRRVTVAPKDKDVVFLLDVLQSAQPTILRKQANTGQFFAVKVDPNNPNAIPIDLHNVKKAYTTNLRISGLQILQTQTVLTRQTESATAARVPCEVS